jgi:hypothetical protein
LKRLKEISYPKILEKMAPQVLPPLRLIRKQETNPKYQEFKIVEPTIAQVLPPLRLKRKQTINPKYQEFKIVEQLIAPQVLPLVLRLKRKRSRYQEFKISESGPPAKSSKSEETSDSSIDIDSNEREDVVVKADEKGEFEHGKHEHGEPEHKEPEHGKPEHEPDQREPDCVFKTRHYYDQGVMVTEWDFCPYSEIEEIIKNDLVFQGKECNSVNVMKYVEKSCNPIAYEELCKRRFGSNTF